MDDQESVFQRQGNRRWMLKAAASGLGAGVLVLLGVRDGRAANNPNCLEQCRLDYVSCASACASNYKECIGSGKSQSECQALHAKCVQYCTNIYKLCQESCS
jgi:hypothetical protein